MSKKPMLVIVGGANGTGKSTFSYLYRDEFQIDYLGADDIANELKNNMAKNIEIQAGKLFFTRLESYLATKRPIIIESTLSGIGLLKKISDFKRKGYSVSIVYLFLDNVETCKNRIKIRVKKGGHNIPNKEVERRFIRSIRNFWQKYRHEADTWQIFYNGLSRPFEVAVKGKNKTAIIDEEYYAKFKEFLK